MVSCGEDLLTIRAETPSEGTGVWTTSGGALIVNPTNPTTSVADLDSGENWFYWTLSAGSCENYSVDSMVIFVNDLIIAEADFYDINFNDSLENIDVLVNDFFGNSDQWTFEVIQRPQNTRRPTFLLHLQILIKFDKLLRNGISS